MKNSLTKIWQHRYFLLFVFLFVYTQVIYIRIAIRRVINIHIFDIDGPVAVFITLCPLFLIIAYFIKRRQKPEGFSIKEILKIFFISILVYSLIGMIVMTTFAFIAGTMEQNFGGVLNTLVILEFLMNSFIYGGFFLAYYYYRQNIANQQQLIESNQALSESRINQLKAQLNPHFLFNNLNVLDQLISENKEKASDFLNEFAEIYRYVLQISDKKLVPINEELDFAEKYFNLIKHKYGKAYQLKIKFEDITGEVVPLTLQLLLENAVRHNLGTEQNPIYIEITINEKITVSNNVVPKHITHTSGKGLNNLKEQYALLSNEQIKIETSDKKFTVITPIIPLHASGGNGQRSTII